MRFGIYSIISVSVIVGGDEPYQTDAFGAIVSALPVAFDSSGFCSACGWIAKKLNKFTNPPVQKIMKTPLFRAVARFFMRGFAGVRF
jgi:hypothetical protein